MLHYASTSLPNVHRVKPPPGELLNVLIVDDDPDFLDLLSFEIGRIPRVHVTVAHTPSEALMLLRTESYRLVVSDWEIDESTGPEVLKTADRTLSQTAPDPRPLADRTPVLFISGSEKVNETRLLRTLKHFEPVSFVLKRCGASVIGLMASHILERFSLNPGAQPC